MNLHDEDKNLYEENKKDKEQDNINELKTEKMQIKEEDSVLSENKDNEEKLKENKNTKEESMKSNDFTIADVSKKSKKAIIILSIIFILIILTVTTGFALININSTKIILGVCVNGIKIEGLTKEEAIQKLSEEYEEKMKQDIVISTNGFKYSITGEQLEVKVNLEEAVEEAYNIGRCNNIFINNFEIAKTLIKGNNISAKVEYNEELLETVVSDIKVKIPNSMIENSYEIKDNKLVITRGIEGNSIDIEELKGKILEAIKNNSDYNIVLDIKFIQPSEIDIEKIYEQVHKEAKDAYYTTEPFQIFPHVDGVDFDIEKAREMLKENKQVYEIELTITNPEITTNKIGTEAFPDLISSFTTRYDAGLKDRSTNLKLAVAALDETVVLPGEIFSYNKTLGERTVAKGYKQAAGYAGGKVVQTLGGGICQISSTVYDAAVYADLEIIERHNHAFLTSYVGAGKDATVVYGALDFKFKNTRNYPIMIKASASSGIAKVEIYGIKQETEYEIEISSKILSYISYKVIYEDSASMAEGQQKVTQNGMNGCKSVTYKIYKLNGVEVKRETLSTDTYNAMNKYITRGASATTQTLSPVTEEIQENHTSQNEGSTSSEQNNAPREEPIINKPEAQEQTGNSTQSDNQSGIINNAA